MGWPGLNQHHVAGNQACSIGATSGVGLGVENNRTVAICGVAEDLVELDRKPVQMTDMQRAKVRMERVVQKGIVNGEVHRAVLLAPRRGWLSP